MNRKLTFLLIGIVVLAVLVVVLSPDIRERLNLTFAAGYGSEPVWSGDSPSIAVFYPKGGEILFQGNVGGVAYYIKNLPRKWREEVDNVTIELWNGDGTQKVGTICTGCNDPYFYVEPIPGEDPGLGAAANSVETAASEAARNDKYGYGWQEWDGTTMEGGSVRPGRYRIVVDVQMKGFLSVADMSDDVVRLLPQRKIPGVTITYPNGGEVISKNGKVDITWSTSGMSVPNADIILCAIRGDRGCTLIATMVPNNGTYRWDVKSTKMYDWQRDRYVDLNPGQYMISVFSYDPVKFYLYAWDEMDGFFTLKRK